MPGRRGLLVDYGGVLTSPVTVAARAFCDGAGVPPETLRDVIVEAYASHDGHGPIERLETGWLSPAEFGHHLAAEIERRCGVAVDPAGVVQGLFADLLPDEAMLTAVERARGHGVRTALVSNSWGADAYPRERLARIFDALVISGEVGLRKPDPAIFEHALEALGLPARACVFVDDLPANVSAAERLGMAGVLHTDAAGTVPRLAELLELPAEALAARPG